MPVLSALKMRFTGTDLATYLTSSYGDPVESGGVLTIITDTDFRAAQTGATWGPLDSISARIIPGSAGTSTEVVCEMLVQSGTGGTDAGFGIDTVAGQVHCMNRVGYGGRTSYTYNPSTMLYFRMRVSAGSVLWETSTDGETYTLMHSEGSVPAWFSNTTLQLTLAARRVGGAGTNSTFDDVNIGYASGSATWTAAADLVGAGQLVKLGAATWSALAEQTAAGIVVKIAAGSLTAESAMTAAGDRVVDGAATLTADGVLAGVGHSVVDGAATWTADGVLVGTPEETETHTGGATWSATATMTAAGVPVAVGAGTLTGDGAMTAAGIRVAIGAAALSAQSAATLVPASGAVARRESSAAGRRSTSAVARRSSTAVPRRS